MVVQGRRCWGPGLTGIVAILLGAGLACAERGGGAPPPVADLATAPASVILLSLDGVPATALDRDGLPGLRRIVRDGVRAEALVPVFPPNTFPSHVSLATGTHPDRHGIVGNRFLDRERGEYSYSDDASWIEAEPLWVAAERQGIPSAVYFWVGSQTDWHGIGARDRVAPFDDDVGEDAKVDQLLAWLDRPPESRPRLLMSWWHGADHAGHRHGPDSPEAHGQLVEQDRELVRLLGGLDRRNAWSTTTLLVVSDHGMARVDEIIDPEAPLAAAGVGARAMGGGGSAFVHLDEADRLGDALQALGAQPGLRAYASDRLPAAWRARFPARVGDLLVLTEPPFFLVPGGGSAILRGAIALGRSVGAHGYDPAEHPSMHGVFLALGRGVPVGTRIPPVRAVDVAPTVATLLGIDPPRDAEGRALAELVVAP